MQVSVTWGKESYPAIVDEVAKASGDLYNDATRKQKLDDYFKAAHPQLRFVKGVRYVVDGTIGGDQPFGYGTSIGPDIYWVK